MDSPAVKKFTHSRGGKDFEIEINRFSYDRDAAELLEICKNVWGGMDYIPNNLKAWSEDQHYDLFALRSKGDENLDVAFRENFPGTTAPEYVLASFGGVWNSCVDDIYFLKAARTHSKTQGRGYASLLMRHKLDYAKNVKKAKEIRWLTWSNNVAMTNIANSLGFRIVGLEHLVEFKAKDSFLPKLQEDHRKSVEANDIAAQLSTKWKRVSLQDYEASLIEEVLKDCTNPLFRTSLNWEYDFFPIKSYRIRGFVEAGYVFAVNEGEHKSVLIIHPSWESNKRSYTCAVTGESWEATRAAVYFAMDHLKLEGDKDLWLIFTAQPKDTSEDNYIAKQIATQDTFNCFSLNP
eukprot:TRINITY_DN9771_c0_g1_i1.p1 TRINITY_DN9771_c0_g1~~TRINITY_DN9771_c0_g1_i1.p1  ORF type:complete len:349 (-),score=69.43 TRINITY_DN9771_c0_g1_i1:116-1162(-)